MTPMPTLNSCRQGGLAGPIPSSADILKITGTMAASPNLRLLRAGIRMTMGKQKRLQGIDGKIHRLMPGETPPNLLFKPSSDVR